jgi:hypothetical protein
VCQSKEDGGLGLMWADLNGQALVVKLYWCWCSQ